MKEFLSKKGVIFTYVDINESLSNLLGFLKYRESDPQFNKVRDNGAVGLPCTVIDDEKVIIGNVEMKDLE